MYYLVFDSGSDDPTESRRFPFTTKEEAEAQRDNDLLTNKSHKKSYYKIVEEGDDE